MVRPAIVTAGRTAESVGLAAIIGGNLFARAGMHPALREVSDPAERGKVVNDAWTRYGAIESLSLTAVIAGWAGNRLGEGDRRGMSERERRLAVAKDAAVAAVALSGVAAALQGIRFSGMEPEGAVPLEDGSRAAAGASFDESRAKQRLNRLGAVNLAAALTLAGINAALGQARANPGAGERRRLCCRR
ncbi:MAG: hypothetical protein ACM3NV_04120 [Syntrophothermus sp.]